VQAVRTHLLAQLHHEVGDVFVTEFIISLVLIFHRSDNLEQHFLHGFILKPGQTVCIQIEQLVEGEQSVQWLLGIGVNVAHDRFEFIHWNPIPDSPEFSQFLLVEQVYEIRILVVLNVDVFGELVKVLVLLFVFRAGLAGAAGD